mgnify:CR=1 FL=1
MNTTTLPARPTAPAPMSVFERYLTVWVFLCIVVGIGLGQLWPGAFQAIGRMEVAQVNLPVGVLIWVMVIPMLMKVDFAALGEVRQHMRGIGVTLVVNWLVKPFSMAFLGWLFIRQWFAPPSNNCHRTRQPAITRPQDETRDIAGWAAYLDGPILAIKPVRVRFVVVLPWGPPAVVNGSLDLS